MGAADMDERVSDEDFPLLYDIFMKYGSLLVPLHYLVHISRNIKLPSVIKVVFDRLFEGIVEKFVGVLQ